jgi:hypothetical protein
MSDQDLLAKIRQAVKLRNEALATFETSRETFTSRAKDVGALLIEARKGKTVKEFDAYLKQVEGLSLSWAYEAMALAGGRLSRSKRRSRPKVDMAATLVVLRGCCLTKFTAKVAVQS